MRICLVIALSVVVLAGCTSIPPRDQESDDETATNWSLGLTSESSDIRRRSAEALSHMGKQAAYAAPQLILTLNDSDKWTRKYAAHALGGIGVPARAAIPPLIQSLSSDESTMVRAAAATALGDIASDRDHEVVLALIAALRQDAQVRLAAYPSLGKMGSVAVPSLIEQLGQEGTGSLALLALAMMGKQAARPLAAALKSTNVTVRCRAAESFVQMGSSAEAALPDLVAALADDSDGVLDRVMRSLKNIGPASILPLVQLLEHEDVESRVRAARALRHCGDLSAVPALTRALEDEDRQVRFWAKRALESIRQSKRTADKEKAL